MSYTCFDISLENKVAHIRLKRPEAYNSMIPEFWSELPEIVHTIDDAGEARAIVLSSQGKHFTAGMDLSVFTSSDRNADQRDAEMGRRRANFRREVLRLQETFSCLDKARMPVLAAIQGGCIGGGVDLISACDIRYCSEDAFFCIQEINIGMTADVGTLQRLPRIVGAGHVAELAYTGKDITAARAKEIGLVNDVHPDAAATVAAARAMAEEIAENSPLTVQGVKAVLRAGEGRSVAEGLDYVALWNSAFFPTNDLGEALAAFTEKRRPRFKGE